MKGQSVAEYGILVGLVIIALYAMATYVQRGLQGRYRDVVLTAQNVTNTSQYEPGYLGVTVDQRTADVIKQKVRWRGRRETNATTYDNSTVRQDIQVDGY